MDRTVSSKPAGGSDKKAEPDQGGDHIRKAQQWGGGSKALKGPITKEDRQNPNSIARR